MSDVLDCPEYSTDHYYSPQFLETSLCVGHEGSLKHYMFKEGEEDCGGEMNQLEAELQTEFELLQIDWINRRVTMPVNYLTLKSLIFKRSKIWILCLNSIA
ncbi:hypothetical protein HA466_0009610 [Hirschfeldia incana]|nr:hypothetical protein HA466_0009610 [Hirschfeldia incana]